MNEPIFSVLFLSTYNSARSIMAEGLLDKLGRGRFHAYSAGSCPAGMVHPFAIEMMQKEGIDVSCLRSKSWDEFMQPGAPVLNFVITVCDRCSEAVVPRTWPGQPITAHWDIFDPAAIEGPDSEGYKRMAFAHVFAMLERRITLLASLHPASLERLALQEEVQKIGRIPFASD